MAFFPNQSREQLTTNLRNDIYRTSVMIANYNIKTDRIQPYTTGGDILVVGGVSSAQALESTSVGNPVVVKGTPPTVGQILISTSATEATWQEPVAAGTAPRDAPYVLYGSADARLTNSSVFLTGSTLDETVVPGAPSTVSVDLVDSGVVAGSYVDPNITVNDYGFITSATNPYNVGPSAFAPTITNLTGWLTMADNGSEVWTGKYNRTYMFRLQGQTASFATLNGLNPPYLSFNITNVGLTPVPTTASDYGSVGVATLSADETDTGGDRQVSVQVLTPNLRFQIPRSVVADGEAYNIYALFSYPLTT